jgi:hypothetical protein
MTPFDQTLLTLACMIGAWYWGWNNGTQNGIEIAITYMQDKGLLKDGVQIEFVDEDEDDE